MKPASRAGAASDKIKAYELGAKACAHGESVDVNPYLPDDAKFRQWAHAYLDYQKVRHLGTSLTTDPPPLAGRKEAAVYCGLERYPELRGKPLLRIGNSDVKNCTDC
jgi:hypothetical protein